VTTDLQKQWQSLLDDALGWKPGNDPEPVLEALCYLLVLRVAGELDRVTGAQARALKKVGAQCLLQTTGAGADEETWVVLQRVSDQARAGLGLLGRREKAPRLHAARLHPSDAQLVRMLNGKLDALTAGEVAAHVIGCERCGEQADTCRMVSSFAGEQQGMALAAASPPSVRPPAEGRSVGARKRPALEAVLFEEGRARRLAVYADEMVSVQLTAEGVATEHSLAGYWIGRLKPGVKTLQARIRVGDRTVNWKLDLR